MSHTNELEVLQQSLAYVYAALRSRSLTASAGTVLNVIAFNPDLADGSWPGALIHHDGCTFRHHPYRTWLDLAELLDLRMLTPMTLEEPLVLLRFQVLDRHNTPHNFRRDDPREKYGVQSPFYGIQKLEEPYFLHDMRLALEMIAPKKGDHLLELGCHRGDLYPLLDQLFPDRADSYQVTGIDHASDVLEAARTRFPHPRFRFLERDLAQSDALDHVQCNHLISVGTLQSPGLDGKGIFDKILAKHMSAGRAGVVLGWPNVRYLDGELRYGSVLKNQEERDLSLLIKDLAFYRTRLQKKGFRVVIRGKYYLILSALREA